MRSTELIQSLQKNGKGETNLVPALPTGTIPPPRARSISTGDQGTRPPSRPRSAARFLRHSAIDYELLYAPRVPTGRSSVPLASPLVVQRLLHPNGGAPTSLQAQELTTGSRKAPPDIGV